MIVINDDVVRGLGIAPETIQRVAEKEGRELQRREQAYREGRPAPDIGRQGGDPAVAALIWQPRFCPVCISLSC